MAAKRKDLRGFAFRQAVPRPEAKVEGRKISKEYNMRLAGKVSLHLRSGALVAIVQDPDEQLALSEIRAGCGSFQPVEVVSVTDDELMGKLEELKTGRGCLIVPDFLAVYGENPVVLRMVREIALQERRDGETHTRLVLLERPEVEIPTTLSGDVAIIRPPLPTIEELQAELEAFLESQEIALEGNGEIRYKIASAVSGLSRHEAARLFARCYLECKELDAAWLRTKKARIVTLRLGGALTFENAASASDVGGLNNLRKWLDSRQGAFASVKAKEWGLPEPKGLLLLGVPGGGKSLTAKMIAKRWGLPLMRLDVGKLFGSLVGQSEAQFRAMKEAAEACAPCVLWIDELEKGFGGNSNDGGTTQRVFGSLLTWLQDKTAPVFVLATANRIKSLPPELLRKGRFDEIFYVGLPNVYERREIVAIHLARRDRTLTEGQVNAIAEASEGFTGAELEQAVIDALFTTFAEQRVLEMQDVINSIKSTVPVSKTMKEQIDEIEKWAKVRARMATIDDRDENQGFQRPKMLLGED